MFVPIIFLFLPPDMDANVFEGRKEPAEASAKQPMEQGSAHPTDIASADEASTPLERQISPLNPDGVLRASQYYNELDHLAVRTAELCSLERLISSGPFDSEEDCIQLMKGTLSALMNLKQEGFCLGYFTVFVEEAQRNVAVSRRVYAKEVETLINTGENRQSLCQRLSVPGSMSVLSTTLALGVTSFAVSHSDQPECPVLDGAVCEIHIAPGLSLSLQPLDCLSDFVGDRLWVVGRRQSEHALKVCINVEDFGLLWGPVWLHGAVCETVGGWLAPVKETSNCNHSEAEYHYVDRFPLDAKDKEPLTETSCLLIGTLDAGKSTTDSSAQNTADLDAAPEEDRAPQGSQSPCSKKPLGAAEDTGIATPNPGAFSVNKACQTSMDSIQQRMALSLHFPGVEKARYESEGYNVGISGGKFVNLSLTEKFKRHKGKTVKDSIFNQNL